MEVGSLSEVGRLVSVVMKHARDAFVDEQTIAAQWKALNFSAAPDYGAALDEYEQLLDILRASGATIHLLPRAADTTLDAVYARDASIVSPKGIILCRMGKPARETEPDAQRRAFESFGSAFTVYGRIEPPGRHRAVKTQQVETLHVAGGDPEAVGRRLAEDHGLGAAGPEGDVEIGE